MSAHTHTHTYIHIYIRTCLHAGGLVTRTQHPPPRNRSCEDASTFYPGKRSTRRRMRNGRCERRPCWTGIRSPHTRLAAACPPCPPRRSVGPSVLPPSLPPSLRARRDGLAQAPAAARPARRRQRGAGVRVRLAAPTLASAAFTPRPAAGLGPGGAPGPAAPQVAGSGAGRRRPPGGEHWAGAGV